MGAQIVGLIALVLLPALLLMHVPVAPALVAVASLGAVLLSVGSESAVVPASALFLYEAISERLFSTELLLLPVIILLGNVTFYSGTATRIYDGAVGLLGRLPGGAAMAAVLGSAAFSAFAGSSTASATTMGRICIPEMMRAGYDPRLATGSVAAGGAVGALLPPSVLLALIAFATGAPVGPMLVAGLLPALMLMIVLLVVVSVWGRSKPNARAESPSDRPIVTALPALGLFALLFAGLVAGVPPIVVVGLGLTLAVGWGLARDWLSTDVLFHALTDGARQTLVGIVTLAGLVMFIAVVAKSGLAADAIAAFRDAGVAPIAILMIGALIGIPLAMFFEPVAVAALLLPFLIGAADIFGLDIIWLSIVLVTIIEVGLIAPPAGLNGFVIDSVTYGASRDQIFAGTARFVPPMLLVLLLLIAFPQISTHLPGTIR